MNKTDILERIRAKSEIEEETGCEIYQGATNQKGYGLIYYNGKMCSVHRVRYQLRIGEIPPGWDVHHTCGNRACCCIEHLRAIPHRLNVACIQKYENLRLARMRLLVATEPSVRESGMTCLTSRRLGDLWDCRSDNVPVVLATMSLTCDGFEWKIAIAGRGRRPTLFTISMAPGLVDELKESVADYCQSVEHLILNLASPSLVVSQ